jgi:hypothetical protein
VLLYGCERFVPHIPHGLQQARIKPEVAVALCGLGIGFGGCGQIVHQGG